MNSNSEIKYQIKGYLKTLKVYGDKVVIIGDSGLQASLLGIVKEVEFSYDSLTELEYSQIKNDSTLTFYKEGQKNALAIGKAVQSASPFRQSTMHQIVDTVGNYTKRNVFLSIEAKTIDQIKEVKSFIQLKISRKNKSEIPTDAVSPADEIRKYKKLFDDGIISSSEFEEKKKSLLSNKDFSRIVNTGNIKSITSHINNNSNSELRFNDEDKSIENDAYKIYLVKKYEITKNDVFSKFILSNRLYDSIEDVLNAAHAIEQSEANETLEKKTLENETLENETQKLDINQISDLTKYLIEQKYSVIRKTHYRIPRLKYIISKNDVEVIKYSDKEFIQFALGEQAKYYLNIISRNGYQLVETNVENNSLIWIFQTKSNGSRFEINSIEELRGLASNFK